MIVLIGRTCTGKTTILNELVAIGYKNIITYTTRPQRSGEKNHVDYHFITKNEFQKMINNDSFAEYRKYETAKGEWYYGTAKEDIENSDYRSVIILTPDGVEAIRKKYPYLNCFVCQINAPDDEIIKRLLKRKDNVDEAKRRFIADYHDFENMKISPHLIIDNDGKTSLPQICKSIICCSRYV